jgi:predicted cupin superfamily sugar epimerase
MLPAGAVSRLHRLRSDECWHYYAGKPLVVVELTAPDQPLKLTRIGTEAGCVPQYMVPAGHWFGSYTTATNTTKNGEDDGNDEAYSLVGCTVAPGFDFADFEFASRATLLKDYALADKEIIERLTEGLP